MNILNYYFSSTGNTEKVALTIHKTIEELGHNVDTIKITSRDIVVEVLKYELAFVGSGVYGQLPFALVQQARGNGLQHNRSRFAALEGYYN